MGWRFASFKFQVSGSPSPDPRPPTLDPRPVSYTPPHLAERIRAEQAALEARGSTDGERKTITALFADLKGSTALIEGLDPEEARAIIDPALQLMMDAVHQYDGYVAQALGDGIFALFGAPIAHEDHPQRAVYAALRMQEAMRRYADTLRTKGYPPLQVRVGVNTGGVVVRSIRKDDLHTDYVPVGHSTNLAARMEQLSPPGAIVVSAYTHRLTDGYFAFKDLGPTQIKGVEEPLNIYEVLGVGPLRTRLQVSARRGLTRFVGRQSEMEQLQRALEQAKAGHGQIVGTMGEPGLGKSRLFYEFKFLSLTGCLVLEAYSVSHGKATAYLPVIELLKSYFEIQAQDDERKRREKVGGKVLMLDRSLEDTLPYLFALERAAQELTLRLAVGPVLMATQGYAAPAVEPHYTRAQELCAQLGDIPQRFPVLWGLCVFHAVRGELRMAQALAEECLQIAEQTSEAGVLIQAHLAVGTTFVWRGELVRARVLLEQSVARDQSQHQALTPLYGVFNPKVSILGYTALALWFLGYPEQAQVQSHKVLHLAQELSPSYTLVRALTFAAWLHVERADAMVALSSEHGFPDHVALGTAFRGAALIVQEQWEEGITQVRQGLEAWKGEIGRTWYLARLARGYGGAGQVEDGLAAVAEALRLVDKNDERINEAELYRVRGELTLAQSSVQRLGSSVTDPRPLTPDPQGEAEACFLKAIEIAQKQQAKSLELRATLSLARLWRQQGKKVETRQILADIYGWFTEGFDTVDLKEAKAFIEELFHL